MATFGDALLPIATKVVTAVNGMAGRLSAFVAEHKPAIEGFANRVGEVFATLGIIWRNWGLILQEVGVRARQWALNVVERLAWLMDNAGEFLAWFGRNWTQLFVDAFNATLAVFKNMATNIANAWDRSGPTSRTRRKASISTGRRS